MNHKIDKKEFINLNGIDDIERLTILVPTGTKDALTQKVGRSKMGEYIRGLLYDKLFRN